MSLFNPKKEWIFWVLLIAPFIYIAYIWSQLPEQIPTHWNGKGQINDYSSKISLIVLPCISIGIYLLLLFIPKLDPRKANYELFGKAYFGIRISILLFFDLIFFAVTRASLTKEIDFIVYIPSVVCIFFSALGYFMKDVKPNYFVGIRTPWTLDNEVVWQKTHTMGGRLWFYGGMLSAIVCLFAGKYSFFILVPVILVLAFVPLVYSYLEYKKIKKRED